MSSINPDCHYGDHNYRGTGSCISCGHRLRCYCGAFVTEDGIEAHLKDCPAVKKAERKAAA